MSRSVFAVDRGIWLDEDFAPEPFTEREAWLWLVSSAAWKDGGTRGNVGPVALRRGEFSFSVRFLAERWKWTSSTVDRFIHRLKKRDMIRDVSRDRSQIYFIKNYNEFQVVSLPKRDSVGTADGTPTGQQRDKEEAGKQESRESSLRSDSKPAAKKRVMQNVLLLIPEWVPKNLWDAFVEMRLEIAKKSKGAPFTDEARRLLLLDLEKLRTAGHDPAAVLAQSIKKGYLGLFRPKEDFNETRGQDGRKSTAHDTFLRAGEGLINGFERDAEARSTEGQSDHDHSEPPRLALSPP